MCTRIIGSRPTNSSTPAISPLQPRATLDTVQRTLERLIDAVEELCQALRQMQQERSMQPATATPPRTPSDVDAAYQRMRVLQAQGLSLTQIATQLDRE